MSGRHIVMVSSLWLAATAAHLAMGGTLRDVPIVGVILAAMIVVFAADWFVRHRKRLPEADAPQPVNPRQVVAFFTCFVLAFAAGRCLENGDLSALPRFLGIYGVGLFLLLAALFARRRNEPQRR